MQRNHHVAQALLVCAGFLTAACDGGSVTAPDDGAAPRFQEYQCPSGDSSCEGPGPNPDFFYGSSVDYSSSRHDILVPEDDTSSLKGRSWSENRSVDIASARVYAVAYKYPLCRTGNKQQFEVLDKTVYGVGTASVNSRLDYNRSNDIGFSRTMGFQMVATHTFTPKPGYTGGGTVYSEASRCDGNGSMF
ncbi:MAG TPA: hypothetical protein VHG51_19385 [Longimicrobiaceae bacterium]|nr:hypothetical protein [Longimicrobiaceae bacterium]